MINLLPTMKMHNWLKNINNEHQPTEFPLNEILQDSLYYPASGFDGEPIRFLSGNIHSFIYVDYGKTEDEFNDEIANHGFYGYKLILSRDVKEKELTPHGWDQTPLSRVDEDGGRREWIYRNWIKKPFAKWLVFQREAGFDNKHGAEKFSFLHLCADGVATFQALYISNRSFPLAIAVIQPGHGYGGNWTNFENPTGILARSVLNNPAGKPEILLFGGCGMESFYEETCWPSFSEQVCFLKKRVGSFGIWRERT